MEGRSLQYLGAAEDGLDGLCRDATLQFLSSDAERAALFVGSLLRKSIRKPLETGSQG
jgi:hypothetical protein